ncbi:hypothetical protein JCM10212_004863 [Sporobolomyces blumeae]
MLRSTALAGLLLASAPLGANAAYDILKSYSGQTFFDDWSFYGHYDNLTNGDAIFVNQSASGSLAYINDAGNAIIKVSQDEVVYNNKRDTVRIQSQDAYDIGSLWVYDAVHVPYGCSVWGAMWSQAAQWPQGGEIDTYESVNLQTNNQMALHTTDGCTAVNASSSVAFDGTLTYANCNKDVNSNSGCTAVDPNANSDGEAFAAAGGGMWATELSTDGVKIWFFTRSAVPTDLSSNSSSIDPTSWGNPTFFVPTSSCDTSKYFAAQHLVIDITLCGDWAGNNQTLAQTGCALTTEPLCYTQYVLNSSNYDNAYFEIPSVRVYKDPSVASTSSSSSSSSGKNSTSGSNATTGGTNSATKFGAGPKHVLAVVATSMVAVGLAVLV